MSKRLEKASKSTAALPSDYAPLLADIKARVQTAQLRAATSVARELNQLYWEIGSAIARAQESHGYGKQVVERLAADLQAAFPGLAGFSPQNVWFMRSFYVAWPGSRADSLTAVRESKSADSPASVREFSAAKVQPPAGRLSAGKLSQPVTESPTATPAMVQRAAAPSPPEPVASLPWGHNRLLLTKLKDREARLWYAAKALEHGWSRNVLALQIEAGLHERQGKAVTNFKATLPPAMSDLAQGFTKDPYLFDFLMLRDDANERAVEDGLLIHVEKISAGAGGGLCARRPAGASRGGRPGFLSRPAVLSPEVALLRGD